MPLHLSQRSRPKPGPLAPITAHDFRLLATMAARREATTEEVIEHFDVDEEYVNRLLSSDVGRAFYIWVESLEWYVQDFFRIDLERDLHELEKLFLGFPAETRVPKRP